jgi:ABC-type spermidine/putrescine transport system, permease component II
MSRLWPLALKTYLGLTLAFLYLPIAVMILMAFNESPLYKLPVVWDTIWFVKLAGNDRLLTAAPIPSSWRWPIRWWHRARHHGAFAFARYQFRGKTLLQILLFPPITIPWLIIGTSMLVLFFWVGIGRGLHSLLLGHVALSIPYVVVVVGARLKTFGPVYEEAAATLGATPWQAFWRISAPLMAPGVIAAALFAFAVSFDQFVISYFLAPPGWTTLPVEIYSAIRKGFTPEINAISTIIILVSMGLMLIFARLYRFGGER